MAVLIALATHAVVSIRAGRVELTVVRTLGFSRIQIFLSLALERVVVSLLGLMMGGAVGYLLAPRFVGSKRSWSGRCTAGNFRYPGLDYCPVNPLLGAGYPGRHLSRRLVGWQAQAF